MAAHAPEGPSPAGEPRQRGAWLRQGLPRPSPGSVHPWPANKQTKWRRLGSSGWALKGTAAPRAWRPAETTIARRRKGSRREVRWEPVPSRGVSRRPPWPPLPRRRAVKRRYHVNAGNQSGGLRGTAFGGNRDSPSASVPAPRLPHCGLGARRCPAARPRGGELSPGLSRQHRAALGDRHPFRCGPAVPGGRGEAGGSAGTERPWRVRSR